MTTPVLHFRHYKRMAVCACGRPKPVGAPACAGCWGTFPIDQQLMVLRAGAYRNIDDCTRRAAQNRLLAHAKGRAK